MDIKSEVCFANTFARGALAQFEFTLYRVLDKREDIKPDLKFDLQETIYSLYKEEREKYPIS